MIETERSGVMKSKRMSLVVAAGAVAAAALAASASGAANVSLLIRHQVRGCHAWSVDGGAYKASQTVTLTRGTVLTVVDNDVMPHRLVQLSGPSVKFVNLKTGMTGAGMGTTGKAAPGAMTHMGASTKVVFTHPGVYRFTTKPGEDYMSGMKTIGEDNVLHLKVVVR
jgi:plastocyanin